MRHVSSVSCARNMPRRSGFTLIELLLVMVILSILATVLTMKFTGISQKANITKAKTEISTLRMAVQAYDIDNHQLPPTLQALVPSGQPSGTPSYNPGGYLDKGILPKDPWDRDYVYVVPGTNGSDFDLFSTGPDGSQHIEP